MRTHYCGHLNASHLDQEVDGILKLVDSQDPDAFVTIEETRSIRRGYMRIARHER